MASRTQAGQGDVKAPPCLRPLAHFCRGCPGWAALSRAAGPGGPWQGVKIACPAGGQWAAGDQAKKADPK